MLRKELGEAPNWEHYLRQFPQHAALLRLLHQADQVVEQELAPAAPVLPPPAASFGNYELQEEIGHGGMGVVFKTWDRCLGRVVAVKMLRTGDAAGEKERKRFHGEARAVARLQHPNIVQIYEVGEAAGQPFFVLEFVEGQSLAQRLDGTPFPARQAAALVEVLARAMHCAHANGVIHRDLKPSNVLLALTPEGCVPKITDFGLAKLTDISGETRSEAVVGTPSYMAPEQAEGKMAAIDPRTDVYGLGAILYELLTGRPPFRAESQLQTLKQVVESEPARPRLLNPAVPRDLETICLKCLEKEPQGRYASAGELADDLGRWLRGVPVQARCVGPLGRLWRLCRRKPVLAGLTAALILALAGGFAGILDQWRKAEEARREAVASDEQGQQLVAELIRAGPVALLQVRFAKGASNIDPLLKAEAYCERLLAKQPQNLEVRIALTNVRGNLGTLYSQRGKAAETLACFRKASDLWEPLVREDPRNPDYRVWLATTQHWLGARAKEKGEFAQAMRSLEQADAYWEELTEEQPGNIAFLERVLECRRAMKDMFDVQTCREESIVPLQETRAALEKRLSENPTQTALRKRLALTCFLLGEIYRLPHAAGEPVSYWQQAHQNYKNLAETRPDDLLVQLSLGICCSRLMGDQAADPCYHQAAALLEQSGKRLAALLEQYPDQDWILRPLREITCYLIVCHSKVGQTSQGEKAFQEFLQLLDAWERRHPDIAKHGCHLLESLQLVSGTLEEVKQPAAALPIARKAAALAERYVSIAAPDLELWESIPSRLLSLSALLRRLGDPAESLREAEHARRILDGLYWAAPEVSVQGEALSSAWHEIGKARWELGQFDAALTAFRESTAVQRQVFTRAPATRQNRLVLSRCLDHLIYREGLRGNRAEVAAALREQEKLWPGDSGRLLKISDDYAELAAALSQGKEKLSSQAKAEQQRYLDASARLKQLARGAEGDSP
jgi:tetratricopeptide (TPR) repeat protein/tRNA A-37 threonylcarbamoyl transferase component Bud32